MREVRCPECERRKDVNDFVTMPICPACITEMEDLDYGKNKRFSEPYLINHYRKYRQQT